MPTFNNRRRNYYIKKEFQRNFILKFSLIVLIGSAVSGTIIYMMSKATVTTSFENLRLVIKSTADYILPTVLLTGATVIIISVAATVFITLFTSHKIAGPLYRIEKDIKEVASGNLRQEFNLRHGDEIKPIAESLNEMTHFLRGEIGRLKQSIAELESLAAASNASADIMDRIKTLKALAEKLKT